MASFPPPAPLTKPGREAVRERPEAMPWVSSGIEAGLLGAASVALFFFVLDWLAGRPFWTPHALGSALFLGTPPGAGEPVAPALILAYTAVHVTVFIGFGVPAAFQVLSRAASMGSLGATALVAIVLFAGFEVVFLGLGELFLPGLVGALGSGRVAVANAFAAAIMAGLLWARARREA